MTAEREPENPAPDASAAALVRAHEKLVACGEKGAAISAMMAVGTSNSRSDGKPN